MNWPMDWERTSTMWERYWLAQIKLAKQLGQREARGAMVCLMNHLCYLAQESAGARK